MSLDNTNLTHAIAQSAPEDRNESQQQQQQELLQVPQFEIGDRLSYKEIAALNESQLSACVEVSEQAVCITRIKGSKVLAANLPVVATNGKPLDEMIGDSLRPLWHPDELGRLMNYINRDRFVEGIEYWSWRYQWNPETEDWDRIRQNLVGNFYAVTYKGVPCRMSVGVKEIL